MAEDGHQRAARALDAAAGLSLGAAAGLSAGLSLLPALFPPLFGGEYGALVDRAAPTELTYAEVQAARAAGRHALLGVVAWLAALDDQALAATLYAPIRAQQEALASRARRRAPTDVDPDTGAELPEPPPG